MSVSLGTLRGMHLQQLKMVTHESPRQLFCCSSNHSAGCSGCLDSFSGDVTKRTANRRHYTCNSVDTGFPLTTVWGT